MKTQMRTLTLALCMILLTAQAATAGPGGDKHFGPMGFFKQLTSLDMTKEQKKNVALLLKEHRSAICPEMKGPGNGPDELHAAMEAEPFDEARIRAAAAKMAAHMEDEMVERARFMADLKKILTPEQLETLRPDDDHHKERKEKMKEHMDAFTKQLDDWITANS